MEKILLSTRQIAKICYSANQEIQRIIGEDVSPDWDELNDDIKASTEDGVMYMVKHLSLGNKVEPSVMHGRWMKVKTDQGWVYGPVKDFDKKTHPQLVPYEQLSDIQKLKDYVFGGVVSGAFYLAYKSEGGMYIGEHPATPVEVETPESKSYSEQQSEDDAQLES